MVCRSGGDHDWHFINLEGPKESYTVDIPEKGVTEIRVRERVTRYMHRICKKCAFLDKIILREIE